MPRNEKKKRKRASKYLLAHQKRNQANHLPFAMHVEFSPPDYNFHLTPQKLYLLKDAK